jgi:quercetin dioxygenase-like cupin family protein
VSQESSPHFIDPDASPSLVQLEGVVTTILSGLHGEKMMMALTTMQPGTTLPEHAHPHEQVAVIMGGEARFKVGNETRQVSQGDMVYIPGNVAHAVLNTGDTPLQALDVFHPIREDFIARLQQA